MTKSSTKKSANKKPVSRKKAIKKKPANKVAVKNKAVKKNQKLMNGKAVRAGNKIVLKAVLAINDAKALHAELGKKLATKKSILIDASAVEMVDTAILQLLLAFTQKSQLQKVAVEWVSPSREFLSRSETLNLKKLLGLSKA